MDDEMKALITGGAGFIGTNLAIDLLDRGDEVTVVDFAITNNPRIKYLLEHAKDRRKLKIIDTDICNTRIMKLAIKGQDVVFHLAAQVSHISSMHDPFNDVETNGKGFISVLEAIRQINPKCKFVFSSSRSVYGPKQKGICDETMVPLPIDMYGAAKVLGEHYARIYNRAYGLNYTIFRQANVYGPMQRIIDNEYQVIAWFFRNVMLGEPLKFWGGEPSDRVRDFIYVGDIIKGYHIAAETDKLDNDVYNIAGGEQCSWAHAFEVMQDVCNIPQGTARYVQHVPYPDKISEVVDNPTSVLNGDKLFNASGYRPSTKLKEGLTAVKEWYESGNHVEEMKNW